MYKSLVWSLYHGCGPSSYQEVKYEKDESKVARAMNNFLFHDLEELSDEVFELKMYKKRSSATCPSRSVSSCSPMPSYAC